ncbi:MAG: hypothetical protein LBE31_08760, partial [Deltaproteobacteria bacterium]|nr:hypothetical protein [Deltaproteobacteria bacterium]
MKGNLFRWKYFPNSWYDLQWQSVINDLTPDFLEFFAPELSRDRDQTKYIKCELDKTFLWPEFGTYKGTKIVDILLTV